MLEGLVTATLNVSALDRVRIALQRPDLRPAFRAARPSLKQDQRDHAKKQSGPGGAWAPRSSSTKNRAGGATYGATRMSRRARKVLGRLPTAIAVKPERTRAIMRSLVRWSDVHMTGGRVGRGAVLPARVFLWISDGALELVSGVVVRHLAKIIEGR